MTLKHMGVSVTFKQFADKIKFCDYLRNKSLNTNFMTCFKFYCDAKHISGRVIFFTVGMKIIQYPKIVSNSIIFHIEYRKNVNIVQICELEKLKKGTLKKVFPHFKGFSTKTFPDLRGFQITRYFFSPKRQRYWGTPCIYFNFVKSKKAVHNLFAKNIIGTYVPESELVLKNDVFWTFKYVQWPNCMV